MVDPTIHAIAILLALRDTFYGEGRIILARAIAHLESRTS